MIRYIKLSVVFILLTGLIFLMVPQGYSQEQQQKQAPEQEEEQGVTQKKIDEAIDKGVEFLWKHGVKDRETELMVLTLLHAGVNPRKKEVRAAIAKVNAYQLRGTYRTALTAMALEKADPHKYQIRIAECAHALVNYQCKNGQWDYNCRYNPTKFGKPKKTREIAPMQEAVVTGQKSKSKKPLKKIIVERRNDKRPTQGDNSNTQFALLGLYAAARCGIEIPKETWQDAADYLTKAQLSDGGWCYVELSRPVTDWQIHSYGSMVCACLCGLAITKHYLDPTQNLLEDKSIKKGLHWLATRLTFSSNPGGVPWSQWESLNGYLYYYIYGIERVGAILGIEQIGNHDWYQEGAEYLLAQQAKDGSWDYPEDSLGRTIDTCFAILFLKRATPPLKPVISGQ